MLSAFSYWRAVKWLIEISRGNTGTRVLAKQQMSSQEVLCLGVRGDHLLVYSDHLPLLMYFDVSFMYFGDIFQARRSNEPYLIVEVKKTKSCEVVFKGLFYSAYLV